MFNKQQEDLIWKALSDRVRRRMVEELAKQALMTGELVELFPKLCRTAVMKHLDVLTAAQLVSVQRRGRQRWNILNDGPLRTVCRPWVQTHARRMTRSLDRLNEVVESNIASPSRAES
ncbi:MAG: helix-turn-helix domain-containing protein [Pirellulaceae bacterium]|jgi:DNA-binding transcriptional ArsR family regulator|nr:helix-turn-helix domain-containing protein [Pirellulaceae bacterium]